MQRALLSVVFVAALAVVASGCAITDYPIIDDVDQTSSGQGAHLVNTSGEAIIVPEIQIATIWPDGSDELLTWVNQGSGGDQVLTTRNNYCPAGDPCFAAADYFAGMVYVNPDSSGCSIWKAQNPAVDDADIFDGKFNPNCAGARSLAILLSTGDRFAEGGRDGNSGKSGSGGGAPLSQNLAGGVHILDALAALNQLDSIGVYGDHTAEYGLVGWKFTFTPDNLEVWFDNTRFMVDGLVVVLDWKNRRMVIDARTGNTAAMLSQLADWVELNGRTATLSISVAGVSPTFGVGLMDADHYRAMADRAIG